MAVDINQFLQTFVEESMEMLQEAEAALLALDINNVNKEYVHQIFRCMHSIKGSSAVFKLDVINEFAHTLENFLEPVRAGQQLLNRSDVEVLLKAIDCLRATMSHVQNKTAIDQDYIKQLEQLFREKISNLPKPVVEKNISATSELPLVKLAAPVGWKINFTPARDMLQLHNEPLQLFQALVELGEFSAEISLGQLPPLAELDPTACYLEWQLVLKTAMQKEEVEEIFCWICSAEDFSLQALGETSSAEEIITKPKEVIIEPEKLAIEDSATISKPAVAENNPVAAKTAAASVRVATDKIDQLLNLIGELVITQSMLKQIGDDFDISRMNKLKEGLVQLEHNSRELQENVMRIRMVPIDTLFNRYSRMVHDLAHHMDKQVELIISGEQTEIDKNMIEKISDPLLHLLRNAIDHGIELPEVRKAKNKTPKGIVQLHAYQEADNIVIDITDDGSGLNKEKIRHKAVEMGLLNGDEEISDEALYQLIFQPGFSTAEAISDISGRGVGLDVAYKNISQLGGEVKIYSEENVGTTFSIILPLTLAIMDCQIVKISGQFYIIPIINISEIVRVETNGIKQIDGKTQLYYFRNNYIPIIHLNEFFSLAKTPEDLTGKYLVIVEVGDQLAGLVVDELSSQQQVVIKSLEENYGKINGIAGVTILGNGKIGLIVDVRTVINLAMNSSLRLRNNSVVEEEIVEMVEEENFFNQPNESFHFLSFVLSAQKYGIDILTVKEIRMWEEATTLPNSPAYIKGVINVRGTIIPVVDLHSYFNLTTENYSSQAVIIILTLNRQGKKYLLGVIADKVSNAYIVKKDAIKKILNNNAEDIQEHLHGFVTVDNNAVAILNAKCLNSMIAIQERGLS